jgi:hypothetical protein
MEDGEDGTVAFTPSELKRSRYRNPRRYTILCSSFPLSMTCILILPHMPPKFSQTLGYWLDKLDLLIAVSHRGHPVIFSEEAACPSQQQRNAMRVSFARRWMNSVIARRL